MKLGQYIVIGGLAYFAFFMLRKPKQDSSVNYDSNGDGIYSGLNEIDRGDGIIEYRSDDGKLSTVNTGFNRMQDGSREFLNEEPKIDIRGTRAYVKLNDGREGWMDRDNSDRIIYM